MQLQSLRVMWYSLNNRDANICSKTKFSDQCLPYGFSWIHLFSTLSQTFDWECGISFNAVTLRPRSISFIKYSRFTETGKHYKGVKVQIFPLSFR